MLRFFLYFLIAITAICCILADGAKGVEAIVVVALMSAIAIAISRRFTEDKEFITNVFLGALVARLIFGIVLHVYDLRDFVGTDANGYWVIANQIVEYWQGSASVMNEEMTRLLSLRGPGWGMNYLVACLYLVLGDSIFVAQSFCAVVGAATVPAVYVCLQQIFQNKQVCKTAALCVAFFPGLVIWSSQLLKDGLIVFLLVLTIAAIIRLQRKFSWSGTLILIFSLFGILSLRFYIFYMITAAVLGSFVIGLETSFKAVLQRTAILVMIGLALTYLGVIRTASADIEKYGSLESVQSNRAYMASVTSGYARDTDVSTVSGALSFVPVGFAYLMFAPFPWEVTNFRQAIALPDVLLWWLMMPLLVFGLWYVVKNKLRSSFPILFFTLMLTVSYSVFQGNVGTAYRQRTQIQVFLFMFIAVGWTLIQEKRADRKLIEIRRREDLRRRMQGVVRPQRVS
ncbi:MAG: glycosyltransferase family 39 protein [Pyrinomonadaceae bacterium]